MCRIGVFIIILCFLCLQDSPIEKKIKHGPVIDSPVELLRGVAGQHHHELPALVARPVQEGVQRRPKDWGVIGRVSDPD